MSEIKNDLRKICKRKVKNINCEKLSAIIISYIKKCIYYKQANNILIYYPLKNEVNILPLIENESKNFYLPKCVNNEIKICKFTKNTVLSKSKLGVFEPLSNEFYDNNVLDLIFAPCVGFNREKYRLGWGGGFYDRFLLKLNHRCKKIMLTFNCLEIINFNPDSHDIPFDFIITEYGLF